MKTIARITSAATAAAIAGAVAIAPAQAAEQPVSQDHVAAAVQQEAAAFAKRVAKTPMAGKGPQAPSATVTYSRYGLPVGKSYFAPNGSMRTNDQTCLAEKGSKMLTCVTAGQKGTQQVSKGQVPSPALWASKPAAEMETLSENLADYGITGSTVMDKQGDETIIRTTQVSPDSTVTQELVFGKKTFTETVTITWPNGNTAQETFTLAPTKIQKVSLPK